MPDAGRRRPFSHRRDWSFLIGLVIIHFIALAAFFTFSWPAFFLCLFLHWLTAGIGICLGYHRYFTHRSFETSKWMVYVLATLGALAGQAGPIAWVAAHRYHHAHSDEAEQDPHSPKKGFWWAHMTWLFAREPILYEYESYKKFTPDMADDPYFVWLDRYYLVPSFILGALLYWWGGISFVVWGIFVRAVIVYHSTWFVNSASHLWGYRNFNTTDCSRNNWWVALLSYGEGWHNNHHAFQRSARHGLKWWEFDFTYLTIVFLSWFGLAKNIKLPPKASSTI